MAWLNPYVINGAAHSAALFRRQAQRPASANSGVAEPGDLLVTKLPSAGPGFRIMPGSLSLKSGYANRERESYGVENGDTAIDITGVEGTGSAARRDAIVVEVLDPNYMPITHEEAALENYTRVTVVQNVPSAKDIRGVPGYTNRTAYVLAFINWPKEQTAIQQSYLEDARVLANPKTEDRIYARPRIGADETSGQQFLTATVASGGEFFPGGSGSPNEFQLRIPEWATRMIIDANWLSVHAGGDNPWGRQWIEFGTEYRPHTWPNKQQYEFATQQFGFNYPNTSDQKDRDWSVADEVPVPPKLRGELVTFVFKAGLDSKHAPGVKPVWMIWNGGLVCRVRFAQQAVGPDLL